MSLSGSTPSGTPTLPCGSRFVIGDYHKKTIFSILRHCQPLSHDISKISILYGHVANGVFELIYQNVLILFL